MIQQRLDELGIVLPEPIAPLGAYKATATHGGLIYTSGQLPIEDGAVITGRLGADLDIAAGQHAAHVAAINALAAAAAEAGGVNNLTGILRVMVYVQSDPKFKDQADVANGASNVLAEIFGEAGRHVRSAVGVAALPKNAAVEVEIVAVHATI